MKPTEPHRLREVWILCFLLGCIMLNYPFIHIFNKAETFLGIPILVLYLLVGWPLSILVIWFFSLQLGHNDQDSHPPDGREP